MRRAMWIVALAAAAVLPPALAQEEPPAPGRTLQQEMAEVNRTLREIVDLMRLSLERHELDVLIRRLELYSRSLAPREQELRRAQANKESVEQELERMEAFMAQLEEEMARDAETGLEAPDSGLERQRADFETHQKLLKDRRWNLEQRIIELENDLTDRRRQIEALEEVVDERLGLR